MITVLHSMFFPNSYKKYVQLNLLSSELYRRYTYDVPVFLKNRPREFVAHILNRLSTNLSAEDVTTINGTAGIFSITSEFEKEKKYMVDFSQTVPSCSCEDWRKHLLPCKHMCCIFKFVEDWGWEKLNPVYRTNPLFVLDNDCFISKVLEEPGKHVTKGCISTTFSNYNLTELPPRRRAKRTILIRNCTQKLKRLVDTVYLIKDEAYLGQLETEISDILEMALNKIPSDYGLPLVESPQKEKSLTDILPLPKRLYGKPKQPGSQRYGLKADNLKLDVWKNVDNKSVLILEENENIENISTDSDKWVSICNYSLKLKDKEVILLNQWLDDNIINAFQKLIAINFTSISGLCDTVILAHDSVSNINTNSVIQIHHLGAHWVVSYTAGESVKIFDSIRTSRIQETLKKQLLKLYESLCIGEFSVLEVDLICCQIQEGSNDCGPFSIANAVALAYGHDLRNINFSQNQMRAHIVHCLEEQKLSMFPHEKLKVPKKTFSKKIQLTKHCTCYIHKPKTSMVECFHCKKWFHFPCVGLKKDDKCVTSRARFYCPGCKKKIKKN
ncbi:uncharacterized protein LOC128655676 [Bombina bombina]|uniref:uncharacterized protein LOC128655676 n=1 Tax=Bombina bombina TaxID=8345 RepID=UPI00235B2DB9|nr:uncharacterized protein LOC128655676 [Bombina bombina]